MVIPTIGITAGLPTGLIMLPFGLLLLAIALGPLIAQRHWERHYHTLCVGLAVLVCLYQSFVAHDATRVTHAAIDYLTFMMVVGSFFVVSGGIHLEAKSPSGPFRNTLFLFFGTLIANFIGTIGASLLLIRPWIAMNKGRMAPRHIAFFIFLICNVGGALLPVGPPLVLGYLKGVPFWWTLKHCWPQWLGALTGVLIVFFILEHVDVRKRLVRTESNLSKWGCTGWHNFIFLFVLLGAMIGMPQGWREPLMIATAAGSYLATPKRIRVANNFTFGPIKEVGWLFLGIFGTMIPVLEYMEKSAAKLGLNSEPALYWASGLFSALLDNAPTYLAFFAAALGLRGLDINDPVQINRFLASGGGELAAISLGAAFFGALTYIGNAPNLLVKTIVEHAGAPAPSFIGYIVRFALPILLPIFALIGILSFS